MKYIYSILFLLIVSVSYSQTVTLECYNNDTIVYPDCAICNKPTDIEVYTGIIVQKITGSDTTRTKIYYPYEIKIRGANDVLMYDSKSHNSFFSLTTTPQFANKIQFIDWLKSCHSTSIDTSTTDTIIVTPVVVEVFRISGDTIYLKISGDTTHFLVISGFTNTDNQKIDSLWYDPVLDSLHLKIENDPRTWSVYINSSGGSGSDKQRFDSAFIQNDKIYLSLQRDTVSASILDLLPYKDSIKQFYINGDSLVLRIGSDTKRFVILSDSQSLYIPNVDSIGITRGNRIKIIENQFLDTAVIVSNHLRLSIKDDNIPFSDIDLSAYLPQVFSYSGTTNFGLTLSNGGGTATFLGTNGIRILNGSTGTVSIDGLNLQWIVAASSGTPQLVGDALSPETVTFIGGGINSTSISGHTVTITGTEVDGSITNELQDLFSTGLIIGLTNSTSTFQLIPGTNIAITSGGTSNNKTYTFSSTDNDNYADSLTFDKNTKILYLGRTGILPTLSDTINFADIDTQRVLVFARHGDTVMIRITGDSLNKLLLPATDTQRILVYQRSNDTLFIRLTNDTTRFLVLPKDSFQVNTDSQRIVLFSRSGDTLKIRIDNDSLHYVLLPTGFVDTNTDSQSLSIVIDSLKISRGNAVSLAKYIDLPQVLNSTGTGELLVTLDQSGGSFNLKPGPNITITRSGTGLNGIATISGMYGDMQYLDTFEIVSNILRASIFGDNIPFSSVNLLPYLDNTDNQYPDTFALVGNTIRLSLFGDNNPFYSINLSSIANINQVIDTFVIVGNILRNSLSLDGEPFHSVDLSPYIDPAQTLNTIGLVTSLSLSGGSIQFISGAGMVLTQGSTGLNASITFKAVDTSTTNELQTLATTVPAANQSLHTLSLSGGSVKLIGGSNITLATTGTALDGIVTISSLDAQVIDTFIIVSNILRSSISGDNQPFKSVDLTPYIDAPQTLSTVSKTTTLSITGSSVQYIAGSNILITQGGTAGNATLTFDVASTFEMQYLDTFTIVGNVLRASIYNDNLPFSSVNLAPYLDNTDNQVIDTFNLIGNTVRLSISGDGQAFKSIDLSSYIQTLSGNGSNVTTLSNGGGTFTINSADASLSISQTSGANPVYTITNNWTFSINANDDVFAAANIVQNSAVTFDGINGIDVARTSGSSTDFTVSGALLQWIVAATTGVSQVIGNAASAETVTFIGGGINSTSISGNTVTITGTEVQALSTISNVTTLSGGTSLRVLGSTGVIVTQSGTAANATYVLSAADSSTTNEIQHFTALGLAIGLSQTTDSIKLIAGTNMSIVIGGTINNPTYTFNASGSGGGNQYLDTFAIVSNVLRASIFGDNVPFSSVNLAPYLDNTDNQVVDTFAIVSNILRLSVSGDNQPFKFVDLSPYIDAPQNFNSSGLVIGLTLSSSTVTLAQGTNITITPSGSSSNITYTISASSLDTQTLYIPHIDSLGLTRGGKVFIDENQYLDTFALVGNILRASIFGDRQGFKSVDLSGYIDAAQTLSTIANTTSISITNSSVQYIGSTGLTIVTGGTASNASLTFTVTDNSVSNEGIIGVADGGGSPSSSSQLISNTSTQIPITINVGGIMSISEITSANGGTINLSALEVQVLNSVSLVTTLTGGSSFQLAGTTGISIAQTGTSTNSIYTFTATDNSVSNETDNLLYSGVSGTITLNISNSQGSGGTDVQFIAGQNITLNSTSTAITINANDNYVDTVFFNAGSRLLTVGRTGVLPDLTTTIPFQTIRPFIIAGDTVGFITQANDTFQVKADTTGIGAGIGGGGGTYTAGSGISIVGTVISNTGDNDNSITNEGQLLLNLGGANTSIISSNSGGTPITVQVNNVNMFTAESGNTMILSAKDTQQLYYDSITNLLSIGGFSPIQLKRSYSGSSSGATNLTYGTATSTSDSIKSSTGTGIAIKVGGTLSIDSTSTTSMRIKNNQTFYTIPNYTGNPPNTWTALTSSTSPTLETNTYYKVTIIGTVNVIAAGGGLTIRLESAASGWLAQGSCTIASNNNGGTVTVQQQTINNAAPAAFTSPPAGFLYLLEGHYILKTNANAGTINWSLNGNGAPIQFNDIRVIFEKF